MIQKNGKNIHARIILMADDLCHFQCERSAVLLDFTKNFGAVHRMEGRIQKHFERSVLKFFIIQLQMQAMAFVVICADEPCSCPGDNPDHLAVELPLLTMHKNDIPVHRIQLIPFFDSRRGSVFAVHIAHAVSGNGDFSFKDTCLFTVFEFTLLGEENQIFILQFVHRIAKNTAVLRVECKSFFECGRRV